MRCSPAQSGGKRFIIGYDAMGFGDVTLMAMIGSFLGWQPILFIFLLAPLCGFVLGIAAQAVSNRNILPYGPFLSLAALIVLCSWGLIWPHARLLFSDPLLVAATYGAIPLLATGLLAVVQLYRHIPTGDPRLRTVSQRLQMPPEHLRPKQEP